MSPIKKLEIVSQFCSSNNILRSYSILCWNGTCPSLLHPLVSLSLAVSILPVALPAMKTSALFVGFLESHIFRLSIWSWFFKSLDKKNPNSSLLFYPLRVPLNILGPFIFPPLPEFIIQFYTIISMLYLPQWFPSYHIFTIAV